MTLRNSLMLIECVYAGGEREKRITILRDIVSLI